MHNGLPREGRRERGEGRGEKGEGRKKGSSSVRPNRHNHPRHLTRKTRPPMPPGQKSTATYATRPAKPGHLCHPARKTRPPEPPGRKNPATCATRPEKPGHPCHSARKTQPPVPPGRKSSAPYRSSHSFRGKEGVLQRTTSPRPCSNQWSSCWQGRCSTYSVQFALLRCVGSLD